MNRSKYQVPEADKNDGFIDIRTFMGTKISDNLKDENNSKLMILMQLQDDVVAQFASEEPDNEAEVLMFSVH